MLQPDLGTSLVLRGDPRRRCCSCRARACAGSASLAAAAVAALSRSSGPTSCATTRRRGSTSFLNPLADIQGAGYQLYQSQIAVGSGGWFGKGLTNGTQNAAATSCRSRTTDFVFAILAEELGFIGALVLFVLFVALLWRVLVAGWRSKDPFGTMFACGVGVDDPVPAVRERRDGHRDHADHRHPAAVHHATAARR